MANDKISFLLQLRDGASQVLGRVAQGVEKIQQKSKGADQSIKGAVKGVGTVFTETLSAITLMQQALDATVGQVAKFTQAIVSGGVELEGLQQRLSVLLGDEQGAARFQELFDFGASTPFEVTDLVEAEVNLRALGIAAEDVLPDVANFAGAMGVDIPQAAVELGRAMQFGAGAVETIAGRAIRAQVELNTGQNALKMSTGEFREALLTVLRLPQEEGGKFAGGIERLASTLSGKISNLQDEWTKFVKQVNDAGLFEGVKAAVSALLDQIDKNRETINALAKDISVGLLHSMRILVSITMEFVEIWLKVRIAINAIVGILDLVRVKVMEMYDSLVSGLEAFNESIGDPFGLKQSFTDAREHISETMRDAKADVQEAVAQSATLRAELTASREAGMAVLAGLNRGLNIVQTSAGPFTGGGAQGGGGGNQGKGGASSSSLFDGPSLTGRDREAMLVSRVDGLVTAASRMGLAVDDITAQMEAIGPAMGFGTDSVIESLEAFDAQLRERIDAENSRSSANRTAAAGDVGGGGVLAGIAGALGQFASVLQGGLSQLLVSLGPIGQIVAVIVGLVGGGADPFRQLLDTVGDIVLNLVGALPEVVGEVIPDFLEEFLAALIDSLDVLIIGLLDAIGQLLLRLPAIIFDVIRLALEEVVEILISTIDGLGGLIVDTLVNLPINIGQAIIDAIRDGLDFGVGDGFTSTLGATNRISELAGGVREAVGREQAGVFIDGRKFGEWFRNIGSQRNTATT